MSEAYWEQIANDQREHIAAQAERIARLEAALRITLTYGLPPHDMSGSAQWEKAHAALTAARRAGLEEAAGIADTFIARDLAAFNAGRADNPLWTTALVEACGPVLRQVAAAIRERARGLGGA